MSKGWGRYEQRRLQEDLDPTGVIYEGPAETRRPTGRERFRDLTPAERLTMIVEEGLIKRQPCPYCGADVAEECRSTPGNWPCAPHAGRRSLAQP